MACSCGSAKNGKVSGCKNNGACNTGGCNKMNVFDWLSNMEIPVEDKFNIVEVRFKNGRKEFYRNTESLSAEDCSRICEKIVKLFNDRRYSDAQWKFIYEIQNGPKSY